MNKLFRCIKAWALASQRTHQTTAMFLGGGVVEVPPRCFRARQSRYSRSRRTGNIGLMAGNVIQVPDMFHERRPNGVLAQMNPGSGT